MTPMDTAHRAKELRFREQAERLSRATGISMVVVENYQRTLAGQGVAMEDIPALTDAHFRAKDEGVPLTDNEVGWIDYLPAPWVVRYQRRHGGWIIVVETCEDQLRWSQYILRGGVTPLLYRSESGRRAGILRSFSTNPWRILAEVFEALFPEKPI